MPTERIYITSRITLRERDHVDDEEQDGGSKAFFFLGLASKLPLKFNRLSPVYMAHQRGKLYKIRGTEREAAEVQLVYAAKHYNAK